MQFDDNAVPKEEKNTISRRKVLEALGAGIIATGVIGYTSREATALAYDDELTPELYHSSVRALASAIRTKKVYSAAKAPRT